MRYLKFFVKEKGRTHLYRMWVKNDEEAQQQIEAFKRFYGIKKSGEYEDSLRYKSRDSYYTEYRISFGGGYYIESYFVAQEAIVDTVSHVFEDGPWSTRKEPDF